MHRDDGIIIFKGKKTERDIIYFLDGFQRNINEIAGNKFLRFAIEIWDPKNEMVDDIKHDKTKICKKKNFPFLDIELFYNDVDNLRFRVHLKENQKLKCLNKPSVHTKACFKSMPNSVFKRLTRLATINNDNTNKSVDKIYPDHIKALRKAELIGMKD